MVKTKSVVIADAGPVIHLDELGHLDLLADFGSVIIPETVWLEVQQHRPLALLPDKDWLVRQSAKQFSPTIRALTPLYSLHAGEQEAGSNHKRHQKPQQCDASLVAFHDYSS